MSEAAAVHFSVSWGRLVWGMTSITCSIFVLVILMFSFVEPEPGREAQWQTGARGAYIVIGLITGVCLLYAPTGYRVTPEYVEVVRLAPNWRIPRGAITAASHVNIEQSWRVFGNGGLFGFIGWYRSRDLRTYFAAWTRRDKAVVLWRTAGDIPVVLSPDDPEAFLSALNVPEAPA